MRALTSFASPTAVLLLLIAASLPAEAQNRFEVSGTVVDSTDSGLSGATVVVLQQSDSTMVSFGITRADGAFRMERVPSGEHLLQVTFVGFSSHVQPISITDRSIDVGRIQLDESVAELGELVVRADHVPMVVNRDTLEYNAAAFGLPPNANVEELLRRLPGIEVDRDGTITAQGEQVRQVLVDGREFFGNDPTVATRNLPAEAVDRVQVYDRRSDRAEFTGVDDGDEERTINLALRPESRQGYFGNATAGLGDPGRYSGRASINRFRAGTQLSLITNANNVNEQGFGMSDYMSFMGGPQAMMAAGGRQGMAGVPISSEPTAGFSTTLSGGLNFNHEFTPRTSIRASYLGYYLDHEQDRSILRRQLAGGGAAASTAQQVDQLSTQLNHRVNLNLNHAFEEGHDLRLRSNFQMSDSELTNVSLREARDADDALQNSSETTYATAADAMRGDATLTYRRRFAPGRTMVAEVRTTLNDGDQSGDLQALNQFYQDGNVLTSEEIDQLQSRLDRTFTHSQRLTFTEPLGLRQLVQIDIEHRATSEDREQSVFDRGGGEPVLNPDLSSGFERTYRYLRGGLSFRRAVEPMNLSVGVDVQQARLDGTIVGAAAAVDRRFLRVLPSASISVALGATRNLELRYGTSTREPSMRDLQPFADNSDPLNIYVGNPDLRPEYAHRLTAQFMLFDPFTSTNLFAFVTGSYTLDRIVRARSIDDQLRQTVTPVNASGDWSVSSNVTYGTLIRPLGVRINLANRSVYNRGIEIINEETNRANILRSTFEARLENRNRDVLDAQVGARYTFNDVRYSLNPGMNRSYVNRTVFGEAGYRVTAAWRVMAGVDYNLYSDGISDGPRHVPLVRAEVSHLLLNDRLQLAIEARDILNQNIGVDFTNTSTYIQEERIATLGRHVMLRLTYNLATIGSPRPGPVRVMGG